MNPPTHEAIARQAYELWQNRGCPNGQDLELWLEAERQLTGEGREAFVEHVKAETAAESMVEFNISPVVAQQTAIKAAVQQKDARSPQVPHHTGPKGKPPETGKPVWPKPHSR